MYLDYYGFTEKPFAITPNPRFIFFSEIHKEAFALLLYGINGRFGFIELIGEVGTGKTTVLRTMLNQLDDDTYRIALIFNPSPSAVDLMRAINREYGIPADSGNIADLLEELNRLLLRENSAGRTVVLVIDEAQNLPPQVLEQVRLISNLETDRDKLIQIVLAGQQELGKVLEKPELRQLNQRIALRYRLTPLSRGDASAYIEHRIAIAGGGNRVSFSTAAIALLYRFSRGIPRIINILCDRALLIAYTGDRNTITARTILLAYRDVNLKTVTVKSFLSLRKSALPLTLIVLGILSYSIFTIRQQNYSRPSPTSPAAAPLKSESAQAAAEKSPTLRAFNEAAAIWRTPPLLSLNGAVPTLRELQKQAKKRGLEMTQFNGSLDELASLETPALIPLAGNGTTPAGFIALTGHQNGTLIVSPKIQGRSTFTSAELDAIRRGRPFVVWRNSANIPTKAAPGRKSPGIVKLQVFLQVAGYPYVAVNGINDKATVRAVGEFQTSRGLRKTGALDPVTLIHLYKSLNGPVMPDLKRAHVAGDQ
jgi:general secretion pathway protein A